MGEPLGLIDANDPKYRDLLGRLAGSEDNPAAAAKHSHSDPSPVASVRPFVGFDRERSTYARHKPELLAKARGQFVVIVGDEIEGPLATRGDAERAGYRRFGFGPLYIKQIAVDEPVQEVSRDITPCRP